MSYSRIVAAAAAACAAAVVLAMHTFAAIDLLRIKLVQAPLSSADGRVAVTTERFPELNVLHAPFALIARVHNQADEARSFSFAIDGTAVCSREVRPRRDQRIDCDVTRWNPAADHVVTIEGALASQAGSTLPARWTLSSLELATHHGSVSGTHYLVVLPGTSDRFLHPSRAWIALMSVFIFVLVAIPIRASLFPGPPRIMWSAYVVFACALTLLMATIECSERLTNFRVVLSADTFSLWLAVLLLPHARLAIRGSLSRMEAAGRQWIVVARAGLIALLVFAVYGVVVRTRVRDAYRGNYSGVLLVSRQYFDGNPLFASRDDIRKALILEPGGGYDAQFMYFAAFDPFLRAFKDRPAMYRQVMDQAPYRFGRIGYSWLTYLLAGGRWERYASTMVWLVLCSLAVAAFMLALMAQEHGLTAAVGALIIAVPGFWQSVQVGLPEPIAAATLLAGIFLLSRQKWWLAGGVFALSLLIRETGAVMVGCSVAAAMMAGRRREAAIVALLAAAPLLAWRFYVAWMLFPDWGLQGLLSNASNFGWPLEGIGDLWKSIGQGQYFPGRYALSLAGIAYPLLLVGGFALAVVLGATRRDSTSFAALIYAVLAICLNYSAVWLYLGNGQRVTYELFLALALSALSSRAYARPLRTGLIAFWSCSVAYVFLLAFDASYIRAALGIPF